MINFGPFPFSKKYKRLMLEIFFQALSCIPHILIFPNFLAISSLVHGLRGSVLLDPLF